MADRADELLAMSAAELCRQWERLRYSTPMELSVVDPYFVPVVMRKLAQLAPLEKGAANG